MTATMNVMENRASVPYGPGFLPTAAHWALTSRRDEGGTGYMILNEDTGPHDLSDSDLLARVGANQDHDAFARLFTTLSPRVKAYIMKLGAAPEVAEEIAQETFVTVWRKAAQFDVARSSAVTWIFTIARNLRIDRLRKENRPALDPNEPMLVPNEQPSPIQQIEQAAMAERVRASIVDLPADQQEAIRLSFVEGLSHREISETLDVPLGTVKSRLRLSFKKLKHSLGDIR
jgi:RNA polymerase sigma-70 factor (ECF subfamily)